MLASSTVQRTRASLIPIENDESDSSNRNTNNADHAVRSGPPSQNSDVLHLRNSRQEDTGQLNLLLSWHFQHLEHGHREAEEQKVAGEGDGGNSDVNLPPW